MRIVVLRSMGVAARFLPDSGSLLAGATCAASFAIYIAVDSSTLLYCAGINQGGTVAIAYYYCFNVHRDISVTLAMAFITLPSDFPNP